MMEQNRRESDYCAKELKKKARRFLDQSPVERPDAPPGCLRRPPQGMCPAAVLVPIVNRLASPQILLTKRTDDHPHHAGQISFPGGKVTSEDKHIKATALRETLEETGIEARYIDVLGHLDSHSTGTGFIIYPVVALLEPSFHLKPCAREVAEIFEMPLSFVMNGENFRVEKIFWRERLLDFYVIDYGPHRIWGATAAILKKLQERLSAIK